MIPSILCYVPQSIELLGLTTRQFFKPRPTTTHVYKPHWRRWRQEQQPWLILYPGCNQQEQLRQLIITWGEVLWMPQGVCSRWTQRNFNKNDMRCLIAQSAFTPSAPSVFHLSPGFRQRVRLTPIDFFVVDSSSSVSKCLERLSGNRGLFRNRTVLQVKVKVLDDPRVLWSWRSAEQALSVWKWNNVVDGWLEK